MGRETNEKRTARATATLAGTRRLLARRHALAIAAIAAAAGAVLLAMGRTAWCGCGSWVPWSWDIWTRHNSQHLLDPYTFTHVLHGIAFYGLLWLVARRLPPGARAVAAIALEAAWEVLENTDAVIRKYREATISLDYFGDSVLNSLADVAACLGGFWLAWRLRPAASLALFVLVELALLAWVRDGLVLNVVMLLHPIDAVRAWQLAGAPAP